MALNVGTILNNRYRIVKLVGQGGFGAVYRAWDLSLLQPVALKENSGGAAEAQRQFAREAQLLAGLRHANLPRVSDHFVLPGQGQYLVMDFVEGQSLSDLLAERGGPLGEAEVLPWIRQVCDALEYLHTRTPPVIHRDIKPDNIIIGPDGRAMLVDFGISKVYEENKGTTIGAKAVTPGYSPPEQYGSGRTDARSDVYALGATLYTLLTGQVPPDGPDLASELEALLPAVAVNPVVSETTSGAISAAMAPSISQRLATVGDFLSALTAVAAPAGVVVRQATGMSVTKRRWPALALIGAAAAILALGAWWLSRQDGGNGPDVVLATVTNAPQLTEAVQPTAIEATQTAPPDTPSPKQTATSTDTPLETPIPTAPLEVFDTRTIPLPGGVPVEQLYVPGGSFLMGSASSEADERPVHTVILDAFWIDRTEVTNRQFAAFASDTNYQTLAEQQGRGHGFTTNNWEDIEGASWRQPQGSGTQPEDWADHPVVQVSWDDAQAYCAWAGGRLPTEAEWEYAARGPDARTYPWGDGFDVEWLNYCDRNCFLEWADGEGDDGFVLTSPVGSFAAGASWVGAVDMAGNAWEWTADWYSPDTYDVSPASNPQGPDSGVQRVVRGGSWADTFDFARSAKRYVYAPDRPQNYLGFRCVAPAPTSSAADNPQANLVPAWPISDTGDEACHLVADDIVRMADNSRLWSQPDVSLGSSIGSPTMGQSATVLSGPTWGRIRRDMDFSGWWWEVETDGQRGWVWEDRLNDCVQ